MEDALQVPNILFVISFITLVLILVLMEDALQAPGEEAKEIWTSWRLNPCSNGRCSARRILLW